MKLLVLGSGGQVGNELCRYPWPEDYRVTALDQPGLDITERDAVFGGLARLRPDVVLNAAAYTAVDRAESESAAAWAGNCDGPAFLAAACREAGIPLIHISTDYVFDGEQAAPYREDAPVNPLGVYGRSKAAGEQAVREILPHHVVLRTAWLYSAHGHNFVRTILRLADEGSALRVVADQIGSPTSARDLAAAIVAIVGACATRKARWGTYHFAGAGAVSWYGLAEALLAIAAPWRGPPPRVTPITTAEYSTPARRPANAVLDCGRISEAFGIAPRPWREAVVEVVRERYTE